MQDLSRHTVVITGASSGIGAAVARTFAAGGAKLVLAARRVDRLEQLASDLRGQGAQVLVHAADVSQEQDVIALFAAAEAFSPVTLLIANAGMVSHAPTEECSLDHWQQVIGVNLTGAFLCAREAFRVMKPRGRGRIIAIGSLCASVPREDTVAYSASKFGLEGLIRSLAIDGRAHGITASIVHPGITISEIDGEDAAAQQVSDMKMAGEDVAELIALMAAVPDSANVFTATMLPIAQPWLGRG